MNKNDKDKEKPREIEIIPSYTDVKESDKQEGIDMYGSKPLGGEGEYVQGGIEEGIRKNQEILKKYLLWKNL